MPLSMDEVSNLLEPHFDRLYKCASAGINQYQKQYPNRPIHRSRTRANIAHDLMIDAARQEFDGVAGARIIDISSKHLTILDFDEKVVVLFKKLDGGRTPRNYPTKHAKGLMGGTLDLPGITPAATVVVVGYTLNLEETKVARVSIVRPKGNKIPEWFIDLHEPESNALSMPDLSQEGQTSARRIRAKTSEIQTKLIVNRE